MTVRSMAALLAACALAAPAAAQTRADYPTLERVRFVQECMAEHPGPAFEMTSKCVCVVDALATRLSTDEFIDMTTSMKAVSIGGERGGVLRDNDPLQKQLRAWRTLLRQTKQGCFLQDPR